MEAVVIRGATVVEIGHRQQLFVRSLMMQSVVGRAHYLLPLQSRGYAVDGCSKGAGARDGVADRQRRQTKQGTR